MKLEQAFWFDRKDRTYHFEYRVTVSGELFVIQRRLNQLEYMGGGAPLEYLWESMRRQMMQAIEQRIFKDHHGL